MKSLKLNLNIGLISIFVMLFAFIIMFFSVNKIKNVYALMDNKANIELNRKLCSEKSQELLLTSDYLSSQMWHFVITGETKYLTNYYNEVEFSRRRDIAIKELSNLNLTSKEQELVNKAKYLSDGLIINESLSMRLVADAIGMDEDDMPSIISNVNLSEQLKSLSSYEKRNLASKYVFDEKYIHTKETMKGLLEEFHTLLSNRKSIELSTAINTTQRALNMVQVYNAIVVFLLFLTFILFFILVMKPFNKYSNSLKNLDKHNLSPLKPSGSSEMKSFALVFNKIYSNWIKQNEHLKNLSLIDSLTGIPNRESLYMYIEKLLKEKKGNLGLLILDIDSFKSFNDKYGHVVGDKVLIEIGCCLKSAVSKDVGIAGRLSGEEFVVAIPNTTSSKIDSIANNILDKVRKISLQNSALPLLNNIITASIGSTLWNGEKDYTVRELINEADLALNEAKKNGKNQHIMFSPNEYSFILLQNSKAHDTEVEEEMHFALENGEFIAFYQPKYSLNLGTVIGAEALIC